MGTDKKEINFLNITALPTGAGKLTEREKSLIALTWQSHRMPLLHDAYTTQMSSLGIFQRGNDEAAHTAPL